MVNSLSHFHSHHIHQSQSARKGIIDSNLNFYTSPSLIHTSPDLVPVYRIPTRYFTKTAVNTCRNGNFQNNLNYSAWLMTFHGRCISKSIIAAEMLGVYICFRFHLLDSKMKGLLFSSQLLMMMMRYCDAFKCLCDNIKSFHRSALNCIYFVLS